MRKTLHFSLVHPLTCEVVAAVHDAIVDGLQVTEEDRLEIDGNGKKTTWGMYPLDPSGKLT